MDWSVTRPRLAAVGVPATRLAGLALVAVMGVGAGVRFWGLKWGLPSQEHYFSYHPDETTVVGTALSLNVFTGDLNPHFFNYGSLQLYLVHAACQFASGWGYLDFSPSGRGFIETLSRAHLVARVLTVLMGLATMWIVWVLGRKIGGEEMGVWGAALTALFAGHAVNSHYATVDVPLTWWSTLCLLGCVGILRAQCLRPYLLAGAALGLACATKYGAATLVVPLIVAHVLSPQSRKQLGLARPLGIALLAAAGAFLVGCPYSVLAWPEFVRDVKFEMHYSKVGKGLLFAGTGNGWWYHLTQTLPLSLGWPVLLAALVAIPCAVRARRNEALVLASFVAVSFLMLGSAHVRFARYVVPLLPPLAVLLAMALCGKEATALRRTVLAGLVVVAGRQCYVSCRPFATPDPRDLSAEWLGQNAAHDATVGLLNVPWFYTPPLVPYNGGGKSRALFEQDLELRRFPLVVMEGWGADRLTDPPPYLVMSEFEFREQLRLCGEPLNATRVAHSPEGQEAFAAFWNRLHRDYELAASYGGWRVPRWLAPTGYVPHDWLYAMPETRVYRLKESAANG